MDYVVGSVAALISGNVTPSRPKLRKRALTPIKHQQSPNVTPKSEMVEDRSIFLSPTLQKKKAIVKKSPKRIFQNPDLDVTLDGEGNSTFTSPKADKVKKHLKDDLEAGSKGNKKIPKSKNNSIDIQSPKLDESNGDNELTPKKKKKKSLSESKENIVDYDESPTKSPTKSPKKKNKNKNTDNITEDIVKSIESETINIKTKKSPKRRQSVINTEPGLDENTNNDDETVTESPKKKKKSKKSNLKIDTENDTIPPTIDETEISTTNDKSEINDKENTIESPKKSKKKSKKKKNKTPDNNIDSKKDKKSKKKVFVNPNAVTDKDTDSEHESDNEIESENEENNVVLEQQPSDSSDEEEPVQQKPKEQKKSEPYSDDEVKRTVFVGNVPLSKKVKKDMKRIFKKHGVIETVRIRAVPVKDARVTPKLAVIKNELHPERTTVNIYIKFQDASSVAQALSENNTVYNEHHIRVSRSDTSGAQHDPRCAVFIGNIPFGLEDETLREKFSGCGEIESVRIVRDRKTNAGKGFGYVNFASKDSVELALALTDEDLTIKNKILRVKRCAQSTKQRHPQKAKSFNPQYSQRRSLPQGRSFPPASRDGRKPVHGGGKEMVGAYRRIKNRENQNSKDGPPNKMQRNINQPQREKKTRKEFVGMTAEKRKKQKFNKGQKKKKALSEIMTK